MGIGETCTGFETGLDEGDVRSGCFRDSRRGTHPLLSGECVAIVKSLTILRARSTNTTCDDR
jgi:hypothetical protein